MTGEIAPYAWTYWLEQDGHGSLSLWSECTLPGGEKQSRGSPITVDQLKALQNSTRPVAG